MQAVAALHTHLSGEQLITAVFRRQNAVFELNDVTAMQAGDVRDHDDLPAAVLHGDADVIMLLMLSLSLSLSLSLPLISVSAGCVIGLRMRTMFTDFPRDGAGDDAAGHGVDGIALGDIDEINDAAVDATCS